MPTLTKPFILPGLLPADVLAKPQVKNIQNRRTVHLYIPPPLLPEHSNSTGRKNEEQSSDVPKANGSRNLDGTSSFISLSGAAEIESFTDADIYPSPSRSRVSRPSSLGTRRRTDVRFAPKGQPNPIYHPPSPPTSDLPIPGEDTDIHFHIDPQDMRKKHPATKALFEKVFSNIFFQSFVLIYPELHLLAYTRLSCLPPENPGA
jgi:hypothetical protein